MTMITIYRKLSHSQFGDHKSLLLAYSFSMFFLYKEPSLQGPQTDLHFVSLETVASAAAGATEEPWRFQRTEAWRRLNTLRI